MSFALRLAGLIQVGSLALLFSAIPPACADSREIGGELPLSRHTLVLPDNLPHLAWVLKGQTAALGLDETQRNTLAALAFEARDTLPGVRVRLRVEQAPPALRIDADSIPLMRRAET